MSENKKLFGTDGIRGQANTFPMTAEVALNVGRALVHVFKNGQKPRILIGKDTRLSGYMIETAMASGICSMGGDVYLVGPMPTPAVAFLTQAMRADAGVVISASHNPFQDNGIKIFDREGYKLPDSLELKIESLVLSGSAEKHHPAPENIGKAFRIDDSHGRYIEFCKATFPKNLSLEGLKVVIDCAHGATYQVAPTILEELGSEMTVVLNAEPDGKNINAGVGAMNPDFMASTVRRMGADLGVAFDGDGDRAVFADEEGRVVDGDAILALCAEELMSQGRLKEKTMVSTVMSNKGIEEYLGNLGGHVLRTRVGDRYVVEAMREKGLNFGGEASGHIVFLDHTTTGDGIIAALQVMAILKRKGVKLSQLVSSYHAYPQVLDSIRVKEQRDLNLIPEIQKTILQMEKDLGSQGRILVRYSGTEPILRIMVEGKEDRIIRRMVQDLKVCISKNLA